MTLRLNALQFWPQVSVEEAREKARQLLEQMEEPPRWPQPTYVGWWYDDADGLEDEADREHQAAFRRGE